MEIPPINSNDAPRATLVGGTMAMTTRTAALIPHEISTIGRRELCSRRSDMNPDSGGAIMYPNGSRTVTRMVDSIESPPLVK